MDRIELKRAQVQTALEQHGGRVASGLLVAQVMTATPSCISPEISALDLVRMLHTKAFRHLLVTEPSGRLLGVISDRDVRRCFGPGGNADKQQLASVTAAELMSTDVVTIAPQTPLSVAVELTLGEGISCLPVVTAGTIVGILTNTDLHVVLHTLLQPESARVAAESAELETAAR